MTDKLVVAVLGNRNAGKSLTWNELFGRTVRTGKDLRLLKLNAHEAVEVFLVSSSPEPIRYHAFEDFGISFMVGFLAESSTSRFEIRRPGVRDPAPRPPHTTESESAVPRLHVQVARMSSPAFV
jgi:hypothetical protein